MTDYHPETSIELCKLEIHCDDCNEKTKSIYDVFLDKEPFSHYYDTEGNEDELTAKILSSKDGGFRCAKCDSLNRDYIMTMLYHKKHNPKVFKEQMQKDNITDQLESYLK